MTLLCSYEDDGVGADPQLQHHSAVGAEHGEDAALVCLTTPQLHQQTELFCKPNTDKDTHHSAIYSTVFSGH